MACQEEIFLVFVTGARHRGNHELLTNFPDDFTDDHGFAFSFYQHKPHTFFDSFGPGVTEDRGFTYNADIFSFSHFSSFIFDVTTEYRSVRRSYRAFKW